MGNRARPVEYNAIVNRRFAAGATILQKCIDKEKEKEKEYKKIKLLSIFLEKKKKMLIKKKKYY